MGFNTALTGIDSSQSQLDVTSNNIANAASFGFKRSRAEFADIYSSGIYQKINITIGQGSKAVDVAQQFTQGSTKRTKSVLDMSVQGAGFFATAANPKNKDFRFTRAGAFKLDNENYIVNAHGDYLMGYDVDRKGNTSSLSLMTTNSIQVPNTVGEPERTENLDLVLNLPIIEDSTEARDLSKFNPTDSDTFNFSTASIIYDSVGTQHTLKAYYIKPGVERELWNTDTVKVDSTFGTTMVDCSEVYDPGEELHGRMAWAVFYEFDGKPIQPMNKDKTDVEGFSYHAKNLTFRTEGEAYPNLVTANKSGTGEALSIEINNTKIGSGKLYPGKIASEPPEGIQIPGSAPPEFEADNAALTSDPDKLHIISGDKANVARPKDFWRCQFIFMGQGGEISKPTNPVYLQPAGYVDQIAGENEPSVNVYGTTLRYESFTVPRDGEKVKITHSAKFNNTGGGNQDLTYEITIDDSIKDIFMLSKHLEDTINGYKSQIIPSPASGPPATQTYADFYKENGFSIEVDPYTAEIKMYTDEEDRTQGGGSFVFNKAFSEAEHLKVGKPVIKDLIKMNFKCDIGDVLRTGVRSKTNPSVVDSIDETMYVGLRIGNAIMSNIPINTQPSNTTPVMSMEMGTITTGYQQRMFLADGLKAEYDATDSMDTKKTTFLKNYVDKLNKCLDYIYHPQTIQSSSRNGDYTQSVDNPMQLYSDFLKFQIGSDNQSIDLISKDHLMDVDGLEIDFQLYGSAPGANMGMNRNNDPRDGGYTGGNITITDAPPVGYDGSYTKTDLSRMTHSLNHLDFKMYDEDGNLVLDVLYGSMNRSGVEKYVTEALNAFTTNTFKDDEKLEMVLGSSPMPTFDGTGLNAQSPGKNHASVVDVQIRNTRVASLEPAKDSGTQMTLNIFDESTDSEVLKIEQGILDQRAVSQNFKADPYGLASGMYTTKGNHQDWIGDAIHNIKSNSADQPVVLDSDMNYSLDKITHDTIIGDGYFVPSKNDLGADALFGIAEQDQVVRVKYGKNTMYDSPFQVIDIQVDGNTVGRLTTIDIDTSGLVVAAFTNGSRENLARVALARFNNEQGLLKIGNSNWEESLSSGKAIPGEARSSTFGDINAASLELSNVELSNELVDLIIGQRNYQANARSIEVDGVIQQTILQLK